jgi:biopolymer transport protein ExbD
MAKKRPKPIEEQAVEQSGMAPFIDVTFQLLIFFMLTIKFKQEEGHLLSMLPKDKGLSASTVDSPELQEVRIYICTDVYNHRQDQHLGYKEKHQDFQMDLKKANPQSFGDQCKVWIELNYLENETHIVYRTEKFPSKYSENRRIYKMIADQVKNMRETVKSTRDPTKSAPTIIDSDGLVPWEHPFGFLNALQRLGIHDIEWAGNPRFDRYFGPTGN